MEILDIVKTAVRAIDSKQGLDTEVIRITDLTVLADYFVIATATSSTQLRAMGDEVEYKLSQAGVEPHHIEGKATGWLCLDYGTGGHSPAGAQAAGLLPAGASVGRRRKTGYYKFYWRQNNGV